jgi:hypothetical protein
MAKWVISIYNLYTYDRILCKMINEKLGEPLLFVLPDHHITPVDKVILNPTFSQLHNGTGKQTSYTLYKWLIFNHYTHLVSPNATL